MVTCLIVITLTDVYCHLPTCDYTNMSVTCLSVITPSDVYCHLPTCDYVCVCHLPICDYTHASTNITNTVPTSTCAHIPTNHK